MKKIFFYLMAAIVLTTACNKDEDHDTGPNPMTMTTQLSNVSISLRGTETATIDWGDKTEIETYSLSESGQTYTHVYSGSSIRNITITGNNVMSLNISEQGITKLDVSRNPALTRLISGRNPLKRLDVRNNTALTILDCYVNELTELDLSNNTELTEFNCHSNYLTKLDLSNNIKLWVLNCEDNKLTSQSLNEMFGTLHNYFLERSKIAYIAGNSGTNDCDGSIAENKGWYVSLQKNPSSDW